MCGRFVSSSTPDEIAQYFDASPPAPEAALEPSWNVAPTNDVYVVLETGDVRKVAPLHWGLVPFWAKSPAVGNKMINARAETIAEKNAFKQAFKKRRCIIPADGFYEWKAIPGQRVKQPYFIHRGDGEPLAFAGLWEEWRPKDAQGESGNETLRSTTILTTSANETMAPVHDRMPVILPPDAWDRWLSDDSDTADLAVLAQLLVPAPEHLLVMHPVARDVGNVRNKGPHLIEPVSPAATTDAGTTQRG